MHILHEAAGAVVARTEREFVATAQAVTTLKRSFWLINSLSISLFVPAIFELKVKSFP